VTADDAGPDQKQVAIKDALAAFPVAVLVLQAANEAAR
jgi:hypothetical protein